MADTLTVKRKAYKRKGRAVGASTFKIRDRGAKGRGPKVVPPLNKGSLGGPGFFSKSATERRAALKRLARKQGERAIIGKLRALQVFNKRTNPTLARKALADSKFIAGSFKGKAAVKYPSGLRSGKAA